MQVALSNIKLNWGQPSPEENANYEVCIANISPAERRKRLRFGIIQFSISALILSALLFFGADKLWRLVLYFPLAAAFSGFFQWRDKTWVALARRGARHFGEIEEKIEQTSEADQIKRQARKVLMKAIAASLALTLALLLLP